LFRRGAFVVGAIVLVAFGAKAIAGFRSFVRSSRPSEQPSILTAPEEHGADSAIGPTVIVPDTMRGRSGALRFATLTPAKAVALPGFLTTFGETAIHVAASRIVPQGSDSFALITLRPFAEKRGGYVNGYRLGQWPAERWLLARNYFNPDGFVEVTPANASLRLSSHFVLGDFVTHDQKDVWPKYVVLEEKLIDKLELVLQDLHAHGYAADHVVVLSGFRAPYYNERGVGEGMARTSRHQYGDAADIIIDADGDGRMDDLTKDGRVDLRDVQPIEEAIRRVEARYKDLIGGLGTYSAIGPRGPFAHVDVRGTSARWERALRGKS